MDAESLRSELRRLMTDVVGISGALLATADGLLIAADQEDSSHLESVAALAAATSSVGAQFTHLMRLGDVGATVLQAGEGCLAVHPIGENAVIVIHSNDESNVARLHLAMRQAVPRFQAAMLGQD